MRGDAELSVYVIGDLHLSLGKQKPMDIFPGWENHTQRLENNWKRLVNKEDTVIVPGDISWGMNLDEALPDFQFIESLPGQKIILKGNHDYWWQTYKKLEEFIERNNFKTIKFLFNNSFEVENFNICGTRGWIFESGEEHDDLIIHREAGRLKMSLDRRKGQGETLVFLHYPAIYFDQKNTEILRILKDYGIKRVFYGHLHGKTINYAFNGIYNGTVHKLISADAIEFCPYFINPLSEQ